VRMRAIEDPFFVSGANGQKFRDYFRNSRYSVKKSVV
jgi:hypothetical protein